MSTSEVYSGNQWHLMYPNATTDFCLRKVPWKLSPTRKANARARLKKVDAVIEAVRSSGIQCAALVSVPVASNV